ncbi:MAG: hypothetical protein RLY93_14860 [Sumerlaeia bacterium]
MKFQNILLAMGFLAATSIPNMTTAECDTCGGKCEKSVSARDYKACTNWLGGGGQVYMTRHASYRCDRNKQIEGGCSGTTPSGPAYTIFGYAHNINENECVVRFELNGTVSTIISDSASPSLPEGSVVLSVTCYDRDQCIVISYEEPTESGTANECAYPSCSA